MTEQSLPESSASPVTSECDVLVIGGGPAGATIGALLAQQGHKVAILEKEHHPRFHIGESLLPANLPLFEKLGVAEADQGHRHREMGRRICLALARQQEPDLPVRAMPGTNRCRFPTRCADPSSTKS